LHCRWVKILWQTKFYGSFHGGCGHPFIRAYHDSLMCDDVIWTVKGDWGWRNFADWRNCSFSLVMVSVTGVLWILSFLSSLFHWCLSQILIL
jgi:hypothetical protein